MTAVVQDCQTGILGILFQVNRARPAPIGAAAAVSGDGSGKRIVVVENANASAAAPAANGTCSTPAVGRDGAGAGQRAHSQPDAPAGTAAATVAGTIAAIGGNYTGQLQCPGYGQTDNPAARATGGIRRNISTPAPGLEGDVTES